MTKNMDWIVHPIWSTEMTDWNDRSGWSMSSTRHWLDVKFSLDQSSWILNVTDQLGLLLWVHDVADIKVKLIIPIILNFIGMIMMHSLTYKMYMIRFINTK